MLGQLPAERITPDSVFDRIGLDYAGPFLVKYGSVRKPTIVKSYICVFVSLSVKAVHLELVSDLTSEAFIAALRRFTARRGTLPSYGVIMAQILLVPTVSSKNSISSSRSRLTSVQFRISVQPKTSFGNLYPSIPHTLVDCGNLLLRV